MNIESADLKKALQRIHNRLYTKWYLETYGFPVYSQATEPVFVVWNVLACWHSIWSKIFPPQYSALDFIRNSVWNLFQNDPMGQFPRNIIQITLC